jgi:hypothetical protein
VDSSARHLVCAKSGARTTAIYAARKRTGLVKDKAETRAGGGRLAAGGRNQQREPADFASRSSDNALGRIAEHASAQAGEERREMTGIGDEESQAILARQRLDRTGLLVTFDKGFEEGVYCVCIELRGRVRYVTTT